jgi:hypothetical protein
VTLIGWPNPTANTHHQVVQEPIAGKVAIRAMFQREFAAADVTRIPEVIHKAGDVAILEWIDPPRLRGCLCDFAPRGCFPDVARSVYPSIAPCRPIAGLT